MMRNLIVCLFLVYCSSHAGPEENHPNIILSWDLASASSDISTTGDVSTVVGTSTLSLLTGTLSQTGGGPAELWGSSYMFLTRYFGTTNYPFINFNLNTKLIIAALSFKHFHNHNPGYPSYPSYQVAVQLFDGAAWNEIGTFTASADTNNNAETIGIYKAIKPGMYKIRWVPKAIANTQSEYFALSSISLRFMDFQLYYPSFGGFAYIMHL